MEILCVRAEKGSVHDFKIFKESLYYIHPELLILIDSGYQGIEKLHNNSWGPYKKSKNNPLSKNQKLENNCIIIVGARIKNQKIIHYQKIKN